MKKLLITACFLLPLNSYAICAESSAHTSSRASVEVSENVAMTAARTSSINSSIYAARARQEEINQQQKNITVASIQNDVPVGVLICSAPSTQNDHLIPNGELINSCDDKIGSGKHYISIQQFFDRYKPKDAKKILMVIHDEQRETLEIYYS